MGRAAAVLRAPSGAPQASDTLSLAAAAALLLALAAWDAFAGHLPDVGERWDVLVVAAVLFPATFLVPWLLLPLASRRALPLLFVASAGVAVLLDLAGLEGGFNSAKIVAFTLFGFWFVQMLEALSWVVLVAAVIPWVDIASVYQGPTRVVVEEQPGLFERIAVSFSVPGEDAAARLGPPDVIFFALFLAAARRFGLRARATWLGMTGCLSATLALTYAFDLDGLPALPALSLGFVVPNADLLWRALTTEGRGERRAPPEP